MTSSAEVLQIAYDSRITVYFMVSSATIFGYDYLLTIQEEIHLMWRRPWGLFNYLYFWNKYFGLVVIIINGSRNLRGIQSENDCRTLLQLEVLATSILLTTVDMALVLRVWILYGRKTRFLCLAIFFLLAEIASMITIGITAVRPFMFFNFGPLPAGCFSPKFPMYYGIPGLVMTFGGFLLTVYKCISTLKWGRRTHMPVTRLFLRDGIIWFLAVFSMMIVSVVMWALARASLLRLTAMPAVSAYTIISSRVLLNIKNVLVVGEFADGTMATTVQLGTIRFTGSLNNAPLSDSTGVMNET